MVMNVGGRLTDTLLSLQKQNQLQSCRVTPTLVFDQHTSEPASARGPAGSAPRRLFLSALPAAASGEVSAT